MAILLDKLMTGEVTSTDVVGWLLQRNSGTEQDSSNTLDYPDSVRSSFIQYFINHLRSQTTELTFHGQIVSASPAGKANKLFKALQEQSKPGVKTPRSGAATAARSKVNLFQSPASSADFSDISALDGSFSSLDVSGSFSERGNHRRGRDNASMSSSDGDVMSNRSCDHISRQNTSNSKPRRKGKKVRAHLLGRATPERGDLSRDSRHHNTSSPDLISNFSLESLNDFPSIGSNDSMQVTPRRITPTAVSTPVSAWSEHSSFGDRHSSPWANIPEAEFRATPSKTPKKTPTLEAERSMLRRLKCGKDSVIHVGNAFSPQSPGEKPRRVSLCNVNEVAPQPSKVTCHHQLAVAVDLYSKLLEELLVQNIWMELYFLIQLLTVRGSASSNSGLPQDDDVSYLSTVHNAVYFAVEVLHDQRRYFSLLEKATLRLLIDSDVIQRFKPSFQEELMGYWEHSPASLPISITHGSMLSSVPFHVETDNRENFPSDRSFHSFKKQRDKFYELLREWQLNHSKPGWNIHTNMAGRIRDLVSIASDTANFYHFAKLFTSQLIRMCQEDPHQSTDAPESLLLNNLKIENPDKLKSLDLLHRNEAICPEEIWLKIGGDKGGGNFKQVFQIVNVKCPNSPHNTVVSTIFEADDSLHNLKVGLKDHCQQLTELTNKKWKLEERFTTPAAVLGPCPPPQFKGCQEFFRSFIIEADSYTLNHHLMDYISTRIKELNKFSYPLELRDVTSQLLPDKEQKDQFIACLHTLQVLAKFLGLIKFLPYKQNNGKLTEKLKEEIMAGREQVHHQLDVVSCLLVGFKSRRLILVIPWLVEYFSMMDSDATTLGYYSTAMRHLGAVYRIIGSAKQTKFPLGNQFLLLLLIGWLFEVQTVSPDLLSPVTVMLPNSDDVIEAPLDHIPLVDQSFLYSCCPYLGDIKGLLSEAAVTSPMRKITPVAADVITQPTNQTPDYLTAQVQLDLERNFFHTQSQSLKKSVDFVANRVASNCIKHIDAVLLLNRRKALAGQMMALFQNSSSSEGSDGGEFKKAAQEATDRACKLTMTEANKNANMFVEKKCMVIIQHVLTEDASSQLLQTVCAIAVRNSLQKVRKWIHVQIPGAFKQELESSLQKCLKLQTAKRNTQDENLTVPGGAENSSEIAPSILLHELKDAVLFLLTLPPKDTLADELCKLISKTKSVLLGRQDLTQTTLSAIQHLVKDLFTLTCTISPKSFTTPVRGADAPPSRHIPPKSTPPKMASLVKVQSPEEAPQVQSTSKSSPSGVPSVAPANNVWSPNGPRYPVSASAGPHISQVFQTATRGSNLDKPYASGKFVASEHPHVRTLSNPISEPDRRHAAMVNHVKSTSKDLENNNSHGSFVHCACEVSGCPFIVQGPSQPLPESPGKLCLLHQFMEVLQEQLACKLTLGGLFSARSGVIAGASESDFLRIYDYMSKVLNEEVT